MAYVSDEFLNETPLQYSTASIDDTQNVEVEDNEMNIGIAQHEVRPDDEFWVENEAACVDEAIVNAGGINVATRKKRCKISECRGKIGVKKIKRNS